ncbi:hypothetical protein ACNKHK_14805 [Shigella flexneri]
MRKAFCRFHTDKKIWMLSRIPDYDWESLAKSIKTHGLRNSTLSALMPSRPLRRSPTPPTVLNHHAVT